MMQFDCLEKLNGVFAFFLIVFRFIIVFFLSIEMVSISANEVADKEIFIPYLIDRSEIDSYQKSICEFVLKNYTDQYFSKERYTSTLPRSKEAIIPLYRSQGASRYTASINVQGKQRRIDVIRSNTGSEIYLSEPSDPAEKMNLLSKPNHQEGLSSAIKNGKSWYLIEDSFFYEASGSIRYVYEIMSDTPPKLACRIQLSPNILGRDFKKNLPIFSSYRKRLESISLTKKACQESETSMRALSMGRRFAASIATRPWSVSATWKFTAPLESRQVDTQIWKLKLYDQLYDPKQMLDEQFEFKIHQFFDVWTHREFQAFKSLEKDAALELENYYVTKFSLQPTNAKEFSKAVVESLPGRYYSSDGRYPSINAAAIVAEMEAGNFNSWKSISEHLNNYRHQITSNAAFSLILDDIGLGERVKNEALAKSSKTDYGKTLLMYAAHMNHYGAIEHLIKTGAPVNAVTVQQKSSRCEDPFERINRSALTYASENATLPVIVLLVDAGADTGIVDSLGNSLDYYLRLNPNFTDDEKKRGLMHLLENNKNDLESMNSIDFCKTANASIYQFICKKKTLKIYFNQLSDFKSRLVFHDQAKSLIDNSDKKWWDDIESKCVSIEGEFHSACLSRELRSRVRYLESLLEVSQ